MKSLVLGHSVGRSSAAECTRRVEPVNSGSINKEKFLSILRPYFLFYASVILGMNFTFNAYMTREFV